jgi:hypothetical protein
MSKVIPWLLLVIAVGYIAYTHNARITREGQLADSLAVAKDRLEVVKKQQAVVDSLAAIQDSADHAEMERLRKVAVKEKSDADKRVADLRGSLNEEQKEKLDSVVASYDRRIAADSSQLASAQRLIGTLNLRIKARDETIAQLNKTLALQIKATNDANRKLQSYKIVSVGSAIIAGVAAAKLAGAI